MIKNLQGTATYNICGWHVSSEIPLLGATLANDHGKPVDIAIKWGVVPEQLGAGVRLGPFYQADNRGNCLLSVDGVARYLIEAGNSITVESAKDGQLQEINALLFGTVLGTLAYQRGHFLIHANVIQVGTRLLALSGASGAGKSTLAAALVRRGRSFLTDDVSIFGTDLRKPTVLPSSPIIKLWADSQRAVRLPGETLTLEVEGQLRHRIILPERFQSTPQTLTDIIWIEKVNSSTHAGFELQRGLSALRYIQRCLFSRRIGEFLLGENFIHQALLRVAAQVSVYNLRRYGGLDRVDTLADSLERHVLVG